MEKKYNIKKPKINIIKNKKKNFKKILKKNKKKCKKMEEFHITIKTN